MMIGMENKKEDKTYVLLTIVSTLLLITVMVGTSFAFFSARFLGEYNSISIKSAETGTATAEGTSVNLFVTLLDMDPKTAANDYSSYKETENPATLVITASTGNGANMNCTYDLIYKPNDIYYKSTYNTDNYREFVIYGSQEVLEGEDNLIYTGTLPEYDLTGVMDEVTIVSGATLRVEGNNVTGKIKWNINARYYNLDIGQNDNSGKSFGGAIEVGALTCIPTD